MQAKIAFIDESGTNNLSTEKDGVSNFFIVCAVIIDSEKEDEFNFAASKIIQKHFQQSEMKSSKVRAKGDHSRRIRILKDIQSLDFNFYLLSVNKSLIYKDGGHQYKRTFVKNINNGVYKSLFQHYRSIKIFADETGDQEFSESFKKYVEKHNPPSLFPNSTFNLVSSDSSTGIQIADFLAGSFAKFYEGDSNEELNSCCEMLAKEKSLVGIVEWPPKINTKIFDNTPSDYDATIAQYALKQAEIFFVKNTNQHNEEIKPQICTLRYLVLNSLYNTEVEYLATHKILEHLEECGYTEISEQVFRTNIIAKLRDADVLIASSKLGYKLPTKLQDMKTFAAIVDSQVLPLLDRLNRARKNILMTTSKELDITKETGLSRLHDLLEYMSTPKFK